MTSDKAQRRGGMFSRIHTHGSEFSSYEIVTACGLALVVGFRIISKNLCFHTLPGRTFSRERKYVFSRLLLPLPPELMISHHHTTKFSRKANIGHRFQANPRSSHRSTLWHVLPTGFTHLFCKSCACSVFITMLWNCTPHSIGNKTFEWWMMWFTHGQTHMFFVASITRALAPNLSCRARTLTSRIRTAMDQLFCPPDVLFFRSSLLPHIVCHKYWRALQLNFRQFCMCHCSCIARIKREFCLTSNIHEKLLISYNWKNTKSARVTVESRHDCLLLLKSVSDLSNRRRFQDKYTHSLDILQFYFSLL